MFRVRCGEVELKVTLPAKGLSSSLRDGVVAPFMKVCNVSSTIVTPHS